MLDIHATSTQGKPENKDGIIILLVQRRGSSRPGNPDARDSWQDNVPVGTGLSGMSDRKRMSL